MTVPEGWNRRELSSVVAIQTDSLSQNELTQLPSVSLYSYAAFDDSLEPHIVEGNTIGSSKTRVPQDCVLLGKLNPRIPRIWRVKHNGTEICACSTEFWPVIQAQDSVNLDYLAAVFRSPVFLSSPLVSPASSTGSHQRMNRNSVSKYEILLPPLPEQKKIAAILSSVDETIQATRETIEQTKKVKQGLMQELLAKGIGHTRFKKTEIGEIPEEWSVSNVSDCCLVQNTKRKPISSSERSKIQGSYPYYGPTGIVDYINEYRLHGKYVLIGEDGDHFLKYRTWSMTQLVEGKFNVNNHAHVIKETDACCAEWIHCFFQHKNIIPFLTRQGAGRYKLNKASLLTLPLAVPPINEQREIASALFSFDVSVEASEGTLMQLQLLKKGLMQDLLTGKVRVAV